MSDFEESKLVKRMRVVETGIPEILHFYTGLYSDEALQVLEDACICLDDFYIFLLYSHQLGNYVYRADDGELMMTVDGHEVDTADSHYWYCDQLFAKYTTAYENMRIDRLGFIKGFIIDNMIRILNACSRNSSKYGKIALRLVNVISGIEEDDTLVGKKIDDPFRIESFRTIEREIVNMTKRLDDLKKKYNLLIGLKE